VDSPPEAPGPLTDLARVEAIVADPDPVARNLRITQSYHELARALDARFALDGSWCCFATWASKQAGTFIRGELGPRELREKLAEEAGRPSRLSRRGFLLSGRFLRYARMTVADVAAHVALGNHLVYTRLAPLFARFLALARAPGGPRPEALAELVAGIRRDASAGEELPRAFEVYGEALAEADPDLRAEKVCAANLLVGLHEQVRLQEAIEGGLRAPIRRALAEKGRKWSAAPLPLGLRMALARLFARLFAPAIRDVEDTFTKTVTVLVMSLGHPGGRLRLGEDIPPLADGSMYPEPLRRVAFPEALALLRRLDAAPETLRGSGARDWTRLADRMNYIADYFRSRQRERELLTPPYTPEQVAAIHRGEVPPGPL
jgi:hypothetical protein